MFPLGLACDAGATEIVNYLLDIGANMSVDINSVSCSSLPFPFPADYLQYQIPPLLRAAGAGKSEIVKILLDRGAQVNLVSHVRGQFTLPYSPQFPLEWHCPPCCMCFKPLGLCSAINRSRR